MAFSQPPETSEDIPVEHPSSTATEPVEPDEATAKSPGGMRQWANDLYLVTLMVAVFIVDQVSKQLVRDNIAEGSSGSLRRVSSIHPRVQQRKRLRILPQSDRDPGPGIAGGHHHTHHLLPPPGLPQQVAAHQPRLQLGGAAGNLADRITMGSVTDFVDIGRWPVFNVADASIVVGLGILGWVLWFRTSESGTHQESEEEEKAPLETAEPDEVEETHMSLVCETSEKRLDSFIARIRPALSRSYVQRLVREERILLNGALAKVSLRLQPGDRSSSFCRRRNHLILSPEDIAVTILYSDNDVLVIDKPPGLSVHPAPGRPEGRW